MHVHLDRRRFLQGASALALFGGLGRSGGLWAAPKFRAYPFSLGVAAGDPAPDGFVLWTRLAPDPLAEHGGMPMLAVPVRWEVAEDAGFRRVVRRGAEIARPELGHSVHAEPEGLKPGRDYWYRFLVEGAEASPTGKVRTAPPAGARVDRVRIAVAGCQSYYQGWFGAYRHLSQEPDLDAVFHYGDYIYESPGGVHKQKWPTWAADGTPAPERDHVGDECYTLDDYRRRYAQYKTDPDLQAAHASAAFIMSFDDHEVENDWGGEWDEKRTPPEAFVLRRFAAMQAWYENLPVRRTQFPRLDGGTRYYRRLDYGNLLRMHVLDTRTHRRNQTCKDTGSSTCRWQAGQQSSILGDAQAAWLDEGLGNDMHWNLLAQQVWMMPLKAKTPDGKGEEVFPDKWDGYPGSRQRVVKAIRDKRLTNVVVASGDAHINAIGEIPLRDDEPDGPAAATEFLATSISSNGDGGIDTPNLQKFRQAANPFLRLMDNLRGYHLHDITAREWRAEVKAMDHVQKQGGDIGTRATFLVSPEQPKLFQVD